MAVLIELQEYPIRVRESFQIEGAPADIKVLCEKIRKIFKETQELSKAQRHECFSHIDDLRSRLSICLGAEYMHREVYLRQAENIRNKKSVITNPDSLAILDPLAKRYMKSFSDFKNEMLKAEIDFFALKRSVTNLAQAHKIFSQRFAPLYQASKL